MNEAMEMNWPIRPDAAPLLAGLRITLDSIDMPSAAAAP